MATPDSDNVCGGAEGSIAADPNWQPNDSSAGEANMEPLTNTALAKDRFCISNRAIFAVLKAYQCDVGCISRTICKRLHLGNWPQKVWRERNHEWQDEATNRDDSLRLGELSAH